MSSKKDTVFSPEEKAAIREYAREKKAAARAEQDRAEGESAVLAKIAEMSEPDRSMAARIHEIVKASAPALAPRLWYGMPAYSMGSRIVCFFQPKEKFKVRYATFGFNDSAHLDEGDLWPVAFALKGLNAADEAKISALVKKAVSGSPAIS
ncbi:MAG TPA: DUF1801 domain-containing protein [Anaerolineaceae bacterium]